MSLQTVHLIAVLCPVILYLAAHAPEKVYGDAPPDCVKNCSVDNYRPNNETCVTKCSACINGCGNSPNSADCTSGCSACAPQCKNAPTAAQNTCLDDCYNAVNSGTSDGDAKLKAELLQ